jgi:hypothetical protein
VAQEVVPATGEELASWQWQWGTIKKTVSPVPRKKKGLGPVRITMLLTFLHLFFYCCNLIETAINKRKHSGFFALKLELLVDGNRETWKLTA